MPKTTKVATINTLLVVCKGAAIVAVGAAITAGAIALFALDLKKKGGRR